MGTDTVQAIVSITGTLIAAGALFAVVLQLRHLREDLRGNARASIYAFGSNLKHVFVEHPHLRKYFLENKPIEPDHPDYERVSAIADLYCLYLEQVGTQSRNVAPANRSAWLRYVTDIYDSSPMVRTHLGHRLHWYSVELQQAVRESRAVARNEHMTEERHFVSTPSPDSATPRSAKSGPPT